MKYHVYKDWSTQRFYAWALGVEIHPMKDVEVISKRPMSRVRAENMADRLNIQCGKKSGLYRNKRKATS